MRRLLLVFTALCLGACASQGVYAPRNVSEGIDQAYATAGNIAAEVAILCGHTVKGGPCLEGAAITTPTRDNIAQQLDQAHNHLIVANTLAIDDAFAAQDRLTQASLILTALRALLSEVD